MVPRTTSPVPAPARRARWGIGAVLVALLCSSCGLRASHEEALAAIQTHPDTGAAAPGRGTDATAQVTTPQTVPDGGDVAPAPGSTPVAAAGARLAPSQGTTPATGPSSNGAKPGTGGTKKPAATTQCTGTEPEIKIGTVGQQSGIFAPFLLPGVRAMQAWVASVNALGGVACHRISYLVKDDGGDPSTAQSQVQQLVEGEKVTAMVYMDSPITGNATVNYLTQKGIPVIGSEGGSDWFYSSPVYRPQLTTGNTALENLIAAIAVIGKAHGEKTLGVLTCLEAALCSSLYGAAPDLAKRNNLDLAYRAQASLTQPTFTSTCQSAKSANVNLFVAGMDTNSIIRLIKNCAAIGFKPRYITGGPLVAPNLIADPASEGFYVASYTALYTDLINPQIKGMTDALAKFAPGVPPSISATAGWASAQLFQYALERATTASPAGLLAALGTMKKNDLNGLTAPLTFVNGQNPPRTSCYWIGQVQNRALGRPDGVPAGRICNG